MLLRSIKDEVITDAALKALSGLSLRCTTASTGGRSLSLGITPPTGVCREKRSGDKWASSSKVSGSCP